MLATIRYRALTKLSRSRINSGQNCSFYLIPGFAQPFITRLQEPAFHSQYCILLESPLSNLEKGTLLFLFIGSED